MVQVLIDDAASNHGDLIGLLVQSRAQATVDDGTRTTEKRSAPSYASRARRGETTYRSLTNSSSDCCRTRSVRGDSGRSLAHPTRDRRRPAVGSAIASFARTCSLHAIADQAESRRHDIISACPRRTTTQRAGSSRRVRHLPTLAATCVRSGNHICSVYTSPAGVARSSLEEILD